MKKSLLALALLGAFAGVAQAQTAVQIYGNVDVGFNKKSDTTLSEGKRDNNRLGFKGTEELGGGLKALFQLEIRYEPDTGTTETGPTNRPLFQGQTRVGLQGDFGMVRLGRGLTAYQESSSAFDPFHGVPSAVGFQADLLVAGYSSDPLSTSGAPNRFGNAFFYNSPEMAGFQINATMATKESGGAASSARTATSSAPGDIVGRGTFAAPQYPVGAEATANPFSVSGTYKNGPVGAMLAYERNGIETKLYDLGAYIMATPELKLMANFARQNQEHTLAHNDTTRAWVIGANYTMGAGKLLAGIGQKSPDNVVKTKEFSLGYEYSLSKRTFLYVDASTRRAATNTSMYQLGVSHSF
ncbi:MAG: porin [Pseudomonadota bacterium]